jgi:hypothetical protein
MHPSTKGQAGAAIIVAIIGGLIVLYILFLPPQERAALLGESTTDGAGVGGSAVDPTTILYTSPVGRVLAPTTPTTPHELPTLAVRAVEEGSVLTRRDTLVVENSVFEKRPASIVFSAVPEQTRNTFLSMNLASSTGGRVIVKHNGEEVYNQEPRSRTIAPISLTNLESTNLLEVHVSTVGFSFWRSNRAVLSDVKVTADVTDLSEATVTGRFTIGAEEHRAMQTSLLSFVPVCVVEAPIQIILNSIEIYSGTPDCETLNTLEIAPTRLVSGENTIGFRTEKADILIDRARLTTTTRKEENKQFSFVLDPARVVGRPIALRVAFADTNEKSGYVIINGNRMPLTGGASAVFPITTALRPGANSISFEAVNAPFEVVRFEVVVG